MKDRMAIHLQLEGKEIANNQYDDENLRDVPPSYESVIAAWGVPHAPCVLDIAADSLRFEDELLAHHPEAQVVHSDLSQYGIHITGKQYFESDMRFSGSRDQLPPRSFDAIHARDILAHTTDQEKIVQIARILLQPGGKLLIITHYVTSAHMFVVDDEKDDPLTYYISSMDDYMHKRDLLKKGKQYINQPEAIVSPPFWETRLIHQSTALRDLGFVRDESLPRVCQSTWSRVPSMVLAYTRQRR